MKAIFLFVITVFALNAHGQSVPNSLHPAEAGVERRERKKSQPLTAERARKIYGGKIETRAEFEARMRRTAKDIRKQERIRKKPQYSNPLYFGHKRPPKKHKAGHLKFCRECGIRH